MNIPVCWDGPIVHFDPPLEFESPSDPVDPPKGQVHPLGGFSIKTRYLFFLHESP